MLIPTVRSEAELDDVERPVREAFARFLAASGLHGTDEPVVGLTFKTGMVHFAAKSLAFVPPELPVLLIGAGLTDDEVAFLSATGRDVFTINQWFDNELVYEMLMALTAGTFGWVDADCFVLDEDAWQDLISRPAGTIGSASAFTYDPLGFAKSPLAFWSSEARALLQSESTTLNSYAPMVTPSCRISPYAISRLLQDNHYRYLDDILGRGPDGDLRPHDGLLDVFGGTRTVSSRLRGNAADWFGPDSRRDGWLLDTPMMAAIVLRAHGFTNHAVLPDNRQVTSQVIHVGASGYRERMRAEGASTAYLQRWRLTDLFEVLLAEDVIRQGLETGYRELAELQVRRLRDEAGIEAEGIKPEARSILAEAGVDLARLREDQRMSFLF